MATPAELLDNMVPVSAFSRGKAAQAFSSASNSTPVIVLKNNAPYRVITTPDEYAYLSEVEADMVLMAEAMARLTANQDAGSVPAEEVYAELGIALEDVDAIETWSWRDVGAVVPSRSSGGSSRIGRIPAYTRGEGDRQSAVESSSLIRRGIRKTSWEPALVPVERPDESEIEVGWHPDRVQA